MQQSSLFLKTYKLTFNKEMNQMALQDSNSNLVKSIFDYISLRQPCEFILFKVQIRFTIFNNKV
jgi:hypothetical protein